MDRERARELLPIIQAFAEGKDIQFRPYGYTSEGLRPYEWSDMPDRSAVIQTFPADDYEYRIKPEPREFWAMPSGMLPTATCSEPWSENADAEKWIKVREVLDGDG